MWCKVSRFVKIYMLRLRASDLGIGDLTLNELTCHNKFVSIAFYFDNCKFGLSGSQGFSNQFLMCIYLDSSYIISLGCNDFVNPQVRALLKNSIETQSEMIPFW